MFKRLALVYLLVCLAIVAAFFTVNLASANPAVPQYDSWETKSPMPTARGSMGAAVLSDTIYVVGGGNGQDDVAVLEAYDPSLDQWTTLTSMPTPRNNLAAAAVGGYFYAIAGWSVTTNTTAVERYDPISDTWDTMAPLPHGNNGLRAAVWQDKIYVFGGWDGQVLTDTVTMYDPDLDAWFQKTPMPTARAAAVAVLNGRIYAIAGVAEGGPTNVVEVYDPASDTWSTAAPAQIATSYPFTALVAHGRIFTFSYDGSEMYIPESDSWVYVSTMPTPRTGAGGGNVGDVLYVIGGYPYSPDPLGINEAYTPPLIHRIFLPLAQH